MDATSRLSDGLVIITCIFATWRLASLLVYEEGPFAVFERMRYLAGTHILDCTGKPMSFFGKLLNCLWCTSVWVAWGIFGLIVVFPKAVWLLVPFAFSGAAILLDEMRCDNGYLTHNDIIAAGRIRETDGDAGLAVQSGNTSDATSPRIMR